MVGGNESMKKEDIYIGENEKGDPKVFISGNRPYCKGCINKGECCLYCWSGDMFNDGTLEVMDE
jgi:hypothetical protein